MLAVHGSVEHEFTLNVTGRIRHRYLEDDLVVRRWGPAHPQGELTGISLHMFRNSKLWCLEEINTQSEYENRGICKTSDEQQNVDGLKLFSHILVF